MSWAENYAGSSGLASPKLFNPLQFVRDTGNTAPVCDDVANSASVSITALLACGHIYLVYFCDARCVVDL